jgi:hypothetical protein
MMLHANANPNPMPTPCQLHANPMMRARPKNNPGTKKEKKRREAGCYLLIYVLLIPHAPAQ